VVQKWVHKWFRVTSNINDNADDSLNITDSVIETNIQLIKYNIVVFSIII